MHYGIHGKTAAEIIALRADSKKINMGMTCISKKGLKKFDIFIAKNYLTENELRELNLIVDQYLSFAELQARNKRAMTMENWVQKLAGCDERDCGGDWAVNIFLCRVWSKSYLNTF